MSISFFLEVYTTNITNIMGYKRNNNTNLKLSLGLHSNSPKNKHNTTQIITQARD
jgi:hypothetical protein